MFSFCSSTGNRYLRPYRNTVIKPSIELVIPNQSATYLHALDEKVKSMMEKGQRLIPNGKHENGTPKQATTSICKGCGKEGLSKHKEYLFRVIVVTRPFLQDQVWAFTKLNPVL